MFVSVAAAELVTNRLVQQLLGNESQLISRNLELLKVDDAHAKFKTKIRTHWRKAGSDAAFCNFLFTM